MVVCKLQRDCFECGSQEGLRWSVFLLEAWNGRWNFRYSLTWKDDTLEDQQKGWAQDTCEVSTEYFSSVLPSIYTPLPSSLFFVPQDAYWFGSYQWDPLLCDSQLNLATANQEIGKMEEGLVGVYIPQEVAKSWLYPFYQRPQILSVIFLMQLLFLGCRDYSLSVSLQV